MDITSEVAEALYDSGCLKFGTFRLKSGVLSPYYIDLASVLSSPKDLCRLADIASQRVKQIAAKDRIDKLATIELKGALILPSIACRTNMPCVIVRKETKSYGATGRTAGSDITRGERILFFDDVVTEGLSKVEGIKPLQELGATVEHILVIVDREQHGKEKLEKFGFKVHALAKITELAQTLVKDSKISKEQGEAVLNYVKGL
jgi:orotate phosphoribosyltransferase